MQIAAMDERPNPRQAEAEAQRAAVRQLLARGRLREALAGSERARAEFPQDAGFATMAAYLLSRLGQPARALQAANEALQLRPQDATALFVAGASHRALGDHREAARALLAAWRQAPGNPEIAGMLLEEAVATVGLDAARPIYAEVSAKLSDRSVATCWARLLFAAGREGELPQGYQAARLHSVADWAAAAGVPMDWTGEREAIPCEDPPANGPPPPGSTRRFIPGYAPYVCTLRGATVFTKCNTLLAPDGAALNDMAADPDYGRYIDFFSDRVVAARRDGRLLLDTGQYAPGELDAGILLAGSVSEHYGHWVPEYLCKLHYLENHPRFAKLPIIVDAEMPPQHFEALARLVSNQLVRLPPGGALKVQELVVAGPATFFPVHLTPDQKVPPEKQGGFSLGAVQYIRRRVLDGATPPAAGGRKLYLSRSKRGGRRPLNEDQLADALTARGFETVFTEDMSFGDQVDLFRSAAVIVAPNGSAVLNAFFAPTDVKLFILMQKGLFNWGTYYGLMRELGYEVTFVCSDDDTGRKHSSYTVPLDRLLPALDAIAPAAPEESRDLR